MTKDFTLLAKNTVFVLVDLEGPKVGLYLTVALDLGKVSG